MSYWWLGVTGEQDRGAIGAATNAGGRYSIVRGTAIRSLNHVDSDEGDSCVATAAPDYLGIDRNGGIGLATGVGEGPFPLPLDPQTIAPRCQVRGAQGIDGARRRGVVDPCTARMEDSTALSAVIVTVCDAEWRCG